ncbi:Acyl-CoA N-acyltransferase [Cynara cardunculus var. scolymus]|uniref:Acyl-CoA N-acyltransferase n=1 Tax=Cynara cardunculus var. scolymus TaxID=59895 RepID=A0A118K7E1_CYNCS|nr:Acyl-CoA N-acyltransferase [Cynara cardunculus var. scolymus]
MARKKPSSSASPIAIGNCQVVVEAKNFNAESNQNSLQISVSGKSKILWRMHLEKNVTISNVLVLEKMVHDSSTGSFLCFPIHFNKINRLKNLASNHKSQNKNPKELPSQGAAKKAQPKDQKSINFLNSALKTNEILNLYEKELPSMNYAANTGKKSTFLERCVSNGKYCTLVLKSNSEEGSGEVVAAISFQIIPADTQYAEVPLAAVCSVYQHKVFYSFVPISIQRTTEDSSFSVLTCFRNLQGIGHRTYLEMRKRLQGVGVHSIFCWADEESEGFWLKQSFVPVGQVDTKGRARRLPIRTDIRKALCFPGGSTLMIAHLHKECSDISAESLRLSSVFKPVHKPLTATMVQSQCPGAEEVLKNNYLTDGCQDLVCLDSEECINMGNNEDEMRIRSDGDAWHCSCSSSGAKKRTWETSHTSLKSKKVKGSHLKVCQSDSGCVSRRNKTSGCCMDASPMTIAKDEVADFTPTLGGPLSHIHALECSLGARTTNNHGCVELLSERNCYKIMLMNIADDAKKSNLTKIIEDLGGSVTSDGRGSTHVITGKVRKTLNFCTALCSGAWVISPGWLKESFREGRFVDETPFIVKDLEYELKYRTELKGTVLRARASPGALLKGFEVCLAAHVQPPISTLSAIVRSAGGNVIRNLEKVKDSSKTIFVASEESMDEALSAVKKGIPTFSNEWFMNCVMKQDLDLEAPQFAESL